MTDRGEFHAPLCRAQSLGLNRKHELADNLLSDSLRRANLKERSARLASVIVDEIVPRLRTMHHELSARGAEATFDLADISEFSALLIRDDDEASTVFFDRMREKGHSLETLFVGLLAETARHLGVLWQEDRCDFVEVTLGVARLQKLLYRFSGVEELTTLNHSQRVLLATLPGEKHVFGVDMVAVFMRNASWDVSLKKGLDEDDAAESVADEWFGLVGITLSAESGLEKLARTIRGVRNASANTDISVMVGGPLFQSNPNLVAQVGADATASDAATATILAKKLVLRKAAVNSNSLAGHCR